MTISGSGSQFDGQWIDYYALLDVPVNADEDTIRRRIGKVYADAASNGDHRNLTRREYYQSLVERVLPQCRRVLLDSEWRARYDHQHLLHREKDDAAQNYVEFIASMRSDGASGLNEALLPQRAQDEINAARRVVETALSGAELELLPSQAVSQRAREDAGAVATAPEENIEALPQIALANSASADAASAPTSASDFGQLPEVRPATLQNEPEDDAYNPAPRGKKRRNRDVAPAIVAAGDNNSASGEIVAQVQRFDAATVPVVAAPVVAKMGESNQDGVHRQPGEAARATVITAQEAADIRRRRASNPNSDPFVGPSSRDLNAKKRARSRVVVEVDDPALRRKLSPTSLNLMVAITGVLLTITIQRFAATPAVATSAGRTPIVLAVAPEIESVVERASAAWEKTPAGAGYDVVVQSVDSAAAMQRALGKNGDAIDGWIPVSASYAQRYNELAPAAKRPVLQIGDSLAQTPMVLVARADKAGTLRAAFPDHKIGTWAALRDVVMKNAPGRFGLSDPSQSVPGALARYSMAREWGEANNKLAQSAAKDAKFWQWMAGFEENIPSGAVSPDAMVKDMVLGTTGRYWWAVSYESDALDWLSQGKPLELFYLPRTALADHPFCAVERVGAPVEVAAGRAAFVSYLKSEGAQKTLLQSGFRPTEISPSTAIEKNPFISVSARAQGVQLQGLPRDERFNVGALSAIQKQWSEVYG